MKKISILLLLFILGCQQNKNSKQLIDLVPTDPLLIVKNTSFQEDNSIDFNLKLNQILGTSIDSILFNHKDSKVLISYHKIGKNKIIPIVFSKSNPMLNFRKNILDTIFYDKHVIKKIGSENNFYYSTFKNDIFIESKSKLLVENSIRNSNLISKKSDKELIDLYKISDSKIVIFVSEKLQQYIKPKELIDFFNISKLSSWFQFDVEFNNSGLTLNGLGFQNDSIPKKISYLKDISSSKSSLINIVPENFIDFERFSFDYYKYLENVEKFETINQINSIKKDSILFNINEFGFLRTAKDSIALINFDKKELLENTVNKKSSKSYDYRGFKIYSIENDLINFNNLNFIEFNKKQRFLTIIGENLLISESIESLEKIIVNFSSSYTLETNNGFEQFIEKIPSKNNYFKISNFKNKKSSLLKEIKISDEDFPFSVNLITLDENLIYNTHAVLKTVEQSEDNNIKLNSVFKTDNRITTAPKIVTNYITKEKEIIFQNDSNQLFLVSLDGELIWKKDLNSKIVGDINQVDLYKNGRLQYAFNTSNDFQIIDKNGNMVKKINYENKLGLSVFDYDKIKNYRFFLFNDNIRVLNSKMNNVNGFSTKNLKGKLNYKPKHFRSGDKDYLVFNIDGELKITDRRGNIRIKNKLKNINNDIFFNKNTFTTIDSENNLIRIDKLGKIKKDPLPLESKYSLFANNNNLVYLSENILTINGKNIELSFGDYTKPKIFKTKTLDYISITDKQENKLYIFDANGNLVEKFPVFGSSVIDLFENKKSEKFISVLGEKNEVLIYSFN